MTAPASDARAAAHGLANAVEEALAEATPSRYRDETKPPEFGPTPPVPQPGRPPMSQRATDASALMLAGSALTVAVGGAATGILWASGNADPVVVGLIAGAPPALLLALTRVLRHAKETAEAMPVEHHHHYTGPVHQDQRHSSTRGVWARTNNH
ncbi:hypothetical protein [Streptomyces axinellae]|uniref:Uncharacterized protein n=1 Tax=Streptomyces axinellae TaxID=552788 RepID=A0ABP6CZF7_9ACTN